MAGGTQNSHSSSAALQITLSYVRLGKSNLSIAPYTGFEFSLEKHALIHFFSIFIFSVTSKNKRKVGGEGHL